MKALFMDFLTAGFSGSILILAVIFARLVLRKAPKRWTCMLWLLVGARLLLPFSIESGLSLQPDQSAVAELGTAVIIGQQTPVLAPVLPEVSGPSADETPDIPSSQPVSDSVPDNSIAVPSISAGTDYAAAAAWVWLAGAGAMLAYALLSYGVLKRKLRCAVALGDGVFEDGSVHSPFLLGYLRPRIYLPCHVPQEYRSHILAHERCHIRRGDNWAKLVGYLCLAVHWYNPLVWLAYSLLCRDMEMACDEAVIRTMDTPQRKAYSAALLACATGKHSFSACPVAFGEDDVKQRIVKVLRYKKPAFWLSIAAVLVIAVVAVCFLTDPVASAESGEDPVEKCRQAVERLQSADTYAISQNRSLQTTGGYWYAWDTASSLRSGDNWYHRFESADWTSEYFSYDGRQFAKNTTAAMPEEDVAYREWTETDLSGEAMLQNFCWLLSIEWDANAVTLQDADPAGTRVTLSIRPREENVRAETWEFRFDDAGRLTEACRVQEVTEWVSTCTVIIEYSAEQDAAATLSGYYRDILSGNNIGMPSDTAVNAAMLTQPGTREYELYKDYFYTQFDSGDLVIFADVTHDGVAEMLVVDIWMDGWRCTGFVYTVAADSVLLLYSNGGGADHASGFYGWYLRPAETGYHLAEETFGMGGGIGTLSFEEYYLDGYGNRIDVDKIYVSSDDPESLDGSGHSVSEEAVERYEQELNQRIAQFYLISNTYTNSNGGYMRLADSVWKVFE